MSKLFFFFCLFFLATACENVIDCQSQEAQNVCRPPEGSIDPLPEGVNILEANVFLENFEPAEEEKVEKAISIIKRVVSSPEFKQRVLDFTYQGKKEFVDSKGLTNEQVFQKIIDGMELLEGDVDQEMDLDLELYYSSNNTVGYTYPNVSRIWMNRKYFERYVPTEVANNVFHEWTHKLGFVHAVSPSASRNYTVPYALGNLIEELGKRLQ